MISSLLVGKDASERSTIKAQEIAKINHVTTFDDSQYGLTIEIVSVNQLAIKGKTGIEVVARAWRKGVPLSFDNNVEFERFRYFNPPILAWDGTTTPTVDSEGRAYNAPNFIEDPVLALQQVVAHTVHLTAKDRTPTKGKVGSTTTTVFPAAGTGGGTSDAFIYRNIANPGETWAGITGNAGNTIDSTTTNNTPLDIIMSTTSNQFRRNARAGFTFDTSSIPDTDVVSAAVFSFRGTGKGDPATAITPDLNVYDFTPADDDTFVAGDYNQIGTTAYSTAISYASYNTAGYNDFTLNATGIAAISLTGITKLGLRNANYDAAGTPPTWTSNQEHFLLGNFADNAGTTSDPKLVITHAAGGGTVVKDLISGMIPFAR